MANFVRRIVSGNKARFRDSHLNIELDLVYVTDHIIIMGFPATGVEGLYRNNRDDAKRFLEHRHGKNYWVFNFCPLRENSYPASLFDGHVSRYPFPDHHAPPLAILPLAVREMRAWLSGSLDRVVALHCKAGKGRSGTLACAYLLSLDESPMPPKLERSFTKKEWAKRRADEIMDTIETEDMEDEAIDEATSQRPQEKPLDIAALKNQSDSMSQSKPSEAHSPEGVRRSETLTATTSMIDRPSTEASPKISSASTLALDSVSHIQAKQAKSTRSKTTLEDVLALHTSRRMKAPSSPDKKLRQGVSIPSQRRWLYYWSLVLGHAAPSGFWPIIDPPRPRLRVRLGEIKVRMRELGGVKRNLLRVADKLLEKTNNSRSSGAGESQGLSRGKGLVWVSLARYNDELVEKLEQWEKYTRNENEDFGKRRKGSEYMLSVDGKEETLRDLFTDGRWDRGKMIRSFARLGDMEGVHVKEHTESGPINVHTLRPLSDKRWKTMKKEIERSEATQQEKNEPAILSTASSTTELGAQILNERNIRIGGSNKDDGEGIILDAEREVRVKLYIGSVFMGWFWFIPTFHMPQPPSCCSPSYSNSSPSPATPVSTHLILTRKELDFPLGAGSALVDVDVSLDWVAPRVAAAHGLQPPRARTSEDSRKGVGGEPSPGADFAGVVAAGLQAAVSDASGRDAVEVVQAGDQ